MDAYDAAVLSYALATATGKIKTDLMGIQDSLQNTEELSLTPPTKKGVSTNPNVLKSQLNDIQNAIVNNINIPLPQLMNLCLEKQDNADINCLLDSLHSELRNIYKTNVGGSHFLNLNEDNGKSLLKTEGVCTALAELFRIFGFVEARSRLLNFL